ncbi:hypothetical protein ABMA28_002474 [Loxostege sticticalis]|uniref:Regucalcin n=1 Tax=Loxostege sticticalis TaxID=481309 RepID=A0ABD0SWY8_LOXSC
MSLKVQHVTEPLLLGEGPHWDARTQALYFVNILECSIHKYVPATGEHTRTKLDGRGVSFIIPVEGTTDQFVVAVERKFLVVQWDGRDGSEAKVLKELGEVDKDTPTKRFNDGKADPRGRLFSGTLGMDPGAAPGEIQKQAGSVYRFDGGKFTKLDEGITLSNGLSWDLKEKAFYFTDSMEANIRRYDYDVETGEISNLRYIFDFKKNGIEGLPDGHTIDTDGNLWVAVFEGSCVLQINPRSGKLLRKVPIPAPQVTSVTFGGPNLDVLFVTTGSLNIHGEQKPPSGSIFTVTGLGVKGTPNLNFKL